MLADYHVHTEYSDDSCEDMEQAVKAAMAAGVDEICFTDHVDYGVKHDDETLRRIPEDERLAAGIYMNVDYPAYFRRLSELKEQYCGRITIKSGLEFGVQTHTVARYEELYAAWPLDFVLLSCHQVDDKEFWNHDFQQGKSIKETNDRYYHEILSCVRMYKNYSVLGHLDMIQRYNPEPYPFEASKEIIAAILETAIADGRGIEINTSSFRYGLSDYTPGLNILRLYHELGGTVLTLGSDAHKAADISHRIEYMKLRLKELGFTHFCTFDRMNPIYHQL